MSGTVPPGGMPFGPGDEINGWVIVSHLADGSRAVVFRAVPVIGEARSGAWRVRPLERTEVALKITGPLAVDERSRLLREYLTAKRFTGHPNVVQVLDAFEVEHDEHGAYVVLAQELGDRSLDDRIRRGGALRPGEIRRLVADVATGMAGLHEANFIHSDLKPANLLLYGHRWKLADFGTSVEIQPEALADGRTLAEFSGGTLWYCTPEHAAALTGGGKAPPVHRDADVWAFGVLLHEAATGVHPSRGLFASLQALIARQYELDPGLSPELAAVISACLSDRGTRPRNGRELLELLQTHGLLDGDGAPASGPARVGQPQATMPVPAGGVPTPGGSVGGAAGPAPGGRPRRSPGAGWRRPGRRWWAVGAGFLAVVAALGIWQLGPSSRSDCIPLEMSVSLEKGLLSELADRYNDADRRVDGRCVDVSVHLTASGVAMDALLDGWDDTRVGAPAPQVWTPTSSLWASLLRQRGAERGNEPISLESLASLAKSPLTIALPRPMAEALGWPDRPIGWADVLELSTNPDGWGSKGHPEWGPFVLGKDNPERSTSGMAATVAAYYAATGRSSDITLADLEDPKVRAFVSGVESGVAHYADNGIKFLVDLAEADAKGQATSYISAIVLQEQLVYLYDVGNPNGDRELLEGGREGGRRPEVPLVAVHPEDGTLMMDHPFFVLPSATSEQQAAAADLAAFLREPEQQARFSQWGFRNAEGVADDEVANTIGLGPDQSLSTITPPSPEVLGRMLDDWPELRKKARVLLMFDVSGSMSQPVADGRTRLDAAKAAAVASLDELTGDDEVGLWIFSTEDRFAGTGGPAPAPYQEVLAPAPLATVKEQLVTAIDGLYAGGGTALYHTIRAAQREMVTGLDRRRINAIVVLSDGQNEYPSDDNLDSLLTDLDADNLEQSVRVFAIAFDQDSDLDTLTRIAKATRAQAYDARDTAAIDDVFVSVLSNF